MLSTGDVVEYLAPRYAGFGVERFGVMLLDQKQRVIRSVILSTGTIESSISHPRDMFRVAMLAQASFVVAFHNHPSGDPLAERRRSADDAAAVRGGRGDWHRADGSHHPGRGDVLQLQGRGTGLKVLYFDCFAGAAGDMILGALLDAGLPFEELKRALGSLAVEGWDVSVDRVIKTGVTATKFRVHEHAHSHRAPCASGSCTVRTITIMGIIRSSEIFAAIDRSALSDTRQGARDRRCSRRLGEAEAAIHGMPIDKIHLHEVGALDSIIDIVGAVFAIEWFKADRIVVSPINVGGGMVQDRARRVSGAGAGDGVAAEECAGVFERHPDRSC